jgi:hypothetical protein
MMTTDLARQTARQLVDTIFLAYADKRPLDATDAIDELAVREVELEDLKREAAGLRAWNEKMRVKLDAAESLMLAADYLGLIWPVALEDDAVFELIDAARKYCKRAQPAPAAPSAKAHDIDNTRVAADAPAQTSKRAQGGDA